MSASAPMTLGQHDRIVVRGVELRWVALADGGHLFRWAEDPEIKVAHSHKELWSARTDDEFIYEEGYYLAGRTTARLRSGVATLADIPEREHALMARKLFICQEVVSLERERDALKATRRKHAPDSREAKVLSVSRGDEGLEIALKLMWPKVEEAEKKQEIAKDQRRRGGRVVSGVTPYRAQVVRDWLVLLDKNDWDILALRMKYRNSGRREPQVSFDCERLMNACAVEYAHESKPTKDAVYNTLKLAVADYNRDLPLSGQPVTVPSKRTFFARIRDMEPFSVYAARHGIKKAKHKFRIITSGLDIKRPGERVEMDEVKLHLHAYLVKHDIWELIPEEAKEIVVRRRPWVCLAKDVATKCVLGFSASMEASTDSVLDTIRMIVSDKSDLAREVGAKSDWNMAIRPLHVVTDNGSTMVNVRTRLAFAALRVEHLRTIAGEPQMRGNIESIMRNPNTRLFPLFTGNSFSNVVARGDYPAEKRASMTVLAIVKILFRHILDDYHNRPHRGLGGETPADAWRRLAVKYGEKPLPDRDTLRSIFGVAVKRVIGPQGVAVFGHNFQSITLQEYHRQVSHASHISVKVDCKDLGRVSARLGNEWYPLDCVTPGMKGMSLQVWRETSAILTATHARNAKISEPILLEAMRDARALARRGLVVFGLTETWTTAEEVDRAQSKLDMGWVMPTTAAPPPLFDGWVPATGPDAPSDAYGARAPNPRKGSVEDDGRFVSQADDPTDDQPSVPDFSSTEPSLSTQRSTVDASKNTREGSSSSSAPDAALNPEPKPPGPPRQRFKRVL